MVITELSNDFNWGLGSVLLLLGHVEIINESAVASSNFRSVNFSSSLDHLIIDVILGLVSRSLSGETKGKGLEVLGELSLEKFSNVSRFTSSSRSRNHNVLVTVNEGSHDPLHADGIKGGYHNLIVSKLGINYVLLDSVVPRSPFLGVNVPNVIVDETFFGEGHAGLLDAFTQEFVELIASR